MVSTRSPRDSSAARAPDDEGRDETLPERDDRNLTELIQELCVAGLGFQVLFRLHQKDRVLKLANAMAILGLGTVALAISTAVILVVGFVDRGGPVVLVAVATAVSFSVLWLAIPLAGRHKAQERPDTT